MRPDVLPYVSESAGAGLEIDLVKAIFAETPYQPRFVQLPRVRMIQSFNAELMDGVLTQNVDVGGQGCITDWYMSHQNVGVTASDRSIALNSLSDIANLAVISFDGATRYIGPEFAAEARKSARYTESSDQSTHISLLYNGNFDAAIGDEWILKLAQAQLRERTGEFQPLTIHRIIPATLYGARFHDPAVCQAFNDSLKTLQSDGRYAAIVDRHYRVISEKTSVYENDTATSEAPDSPSHN